MKKRKKESVKKYYKNCLICLLIYLLVFNMSLPAALALDSADVINSSGIIGASWGDNTVINTNNGAIINWRNFDASAAQSVTFNQYMNGSLNRSSAVLNRISSGNIPTQFNGALNANGRVFIVNPAGVIFGKGATINASQLIASSLDISNSKFLNGDYEFVSKNDNFSAVINEGTITVAEGIALIGKKIINSGIISTSQGGFVVMAAGERVVLNEKGSNIIVEMDSFRLPGQLYESDFGDVVNDETGQINAPGGNIVLAAGDIFSSALKIVSRAATFATAVGTIRQNGKINADSEYGKGGSIQMSASKDVILDTGSTTNASSQIFGTGGAITIQAGENAVINKGATVEATGGRNLGDGGIVQISSKNNIISGDINLTSLNGEKGTLLIDTLDTTISYNEDLESQYIVDIQCTEPEPAEPDCPKQDPPKCPDKHDDGDGDDSGGDDKNDGDDEPQIRTLSVQAIPIQENEDIGFSGCPALMKWTADELGIDTRVMQIWTKRDLASARETQPCQTCAKLKKAAAILQDSDGVHIAALAQVINEFASSNAPPSGEQMAMIADAIANNVDTGTQYAVSGKYLDALAEYVGILNNEMNFSKEESIMFAAERYVFQLSDTADEGVIDFLAMRLAAMGG